MNRWLKDTEGFRSGKARERPDCRRGRRSVLQYGITLSVNSEVIEAPDRERNDKYGAKAVSEAASTRQKNSLKRSVQGVHEHSGNVFNAVIATQLGLIYPQKSVSHLQTRTSFVANVFHRSATPETSSAGLSALRSGSLESLPVRDTTDHRQHHRALV